MVVTQRSQLEDTVSAEPAYSRSECGVQAKARAEKPNQCDGKSKTESLHYIKNSS